MQLCGVDLVQMKLIFSENEEDDVLLGNFSEFYQVLSCNSAWTVLLSYDIELGKRAVVFTIEKQYEQEVKKWLKQAAHEIGSALEEIDAPENMVAEIDKQVLSFLKDVARY